MTHIEQALRQLVEYDVEFIIVGGVAATYYGSAYITSDLDICYARHETNLKKLVDALRPWHPLLRGVHDPVPFLFDAQTIKAGLNFTFTTDIGDIDILGELTGLGGYDKLFPLSFETNVFNINCRMLNLDTLIEAKRKAGRQKDITVALELEAIKELERKRKR